MAGTRFAKMVKEKTGICCPWAFLQLHRGPQDEQKPDKWSATRIAMKLLVAVRTVKLNRQGVRTGRVKCLECQGCLKRAAMTAAERGETAVEIKKEG